MFNVHLFTQTTLHKEHGILNKDKRSEVETQYAIRERQNIYT